MSMHSCVDPTEMWAYRASSSVSITQSPQNPYWRKYKSLGLWSKLPRIALLQTVIMFRSLQHVLMGLCIHGWPRLDPKMCPRWALRRTAEKRAYTLIKFFSSVSMCWHFMRAWAQATNHQRAGPVGPLSSAGNLLNEMLMLLAQLLNMTYFSTKKSCFVWAWSCHFKTFRGRGFDAQWK